MRPEVSILGGSGYVGGELLRLLLGHPSVVIRQVASASRSNEPVARLHPNLKGATDLRFCSPEALEPCNVLFVCLPHGELMHRISELGDLAPRIIDLSADFRLRRSEDYKKWYDTTHPRPDLLREAVYGIAELHRERLRDASLVACAGCNATAAILPLAPLFHEGICEPDRTVIEVKVGTSEGGRRPSESSHHPERAGAVRTYRPTGHRHVAEMLQEIGPAAGSVIHCTATALDMVRGVHCVAHVFLKPEVTERDVWRIYRRSYGHEFFIRLVNERKGHHRLPDPRRVTGTNFCDIGFVPDKASNRLVVISAIDNLVRGAAGQAVQALNLMNGIQESAGLEFVGLHPL